MDVRKNVKRTRLINHTNNTNVGPLLNDIIKSMSIISQLGNTENTPNEILKSLHKDGILHIDNVSEINTVDDIINALLTEITHKIDHHINHNRDKFGKAVNQLCGGKLILNVAIMCTLNNNIPKDIGISIIRKLLENGAEPTKLDAQKLSALAIANPSNASDILILLNAHCEKAFFSDMMKELSKGKLRFVEDKISSFLKSDKKELFRILINVPIQKDLLLNLAVINHKNNDNLLIETLLKNGADPRQCDGNFLSALSLAETMGKTSVFKILNEPIANLKKPSALRLMSFHPINGNNQYADENGMDIDPTPHTKLDK